MTTTIKSSIPAGGGPSPWFQCAQPVIRVRAISGCGVYLQHADDASGTNATMLLGEGRSPMLIPAGTQDNVASEIGAYYRLVPERGGAGPSGDIAEVS